MKRMRVELVLSDSTPKYCWLRIVGGNGKTVFTGETRNNISATRKYGKYWAERIKAKFREVVK